MRYVFGIRFFFFEMDTTHAVCVLGQSAFGDKLKYALAGMLTCLVAYVCFDRKAGQSQLTFDAHEPRYHMNMFGLRVTRLNHGYTMTLAKRCKDPTALEHKPHDGLDS